MTTTTASASLRIIIDLTDSLPDITANIVNDSEHYQLPSDIFEDAVFTAINELIDDFALDPDSYLKPKHQRQFEQIAHEYLNS